MRNERLSGFSDDEVYMLSRALIESSTSIGWCDQYGNPSKYNETEQKIHEDLLNELIEERKYRDYERPRPTTD